ncbi:MAG: ferrochelatase [Pirellulales bacterium]|nr:ferrochelatase [Pirellulales bacterium]
MTNDYQAILIVSFGGPEGPDDVLPFLENVLRGRNVPRERMLAVAEHYQKFGGVSPINEQNRALIVALRNELGRHGPDLPIYWGNRNWHPLLADTLRQMADDGMRRAVAFFTSIFSSYSGCRQYRENIAEAQNIVGAGAPRIDKLRMFYNHPGFVETMADRVRSALEQVPAERQGAARLIYTAHSIPSAMAAGCRYEEQLRESCRLVTTAIGREGFDLVYQSRSGPPQQPWLAPDINDHLRAIAAAGARDVVVTPIGFVSDHIEVLYDLDIEAATLAEELGIHYVRAGTAGAHPRFVTMIRELIAERVDSTAPRLAMGQYGPSHDVCADDCCPSGRPS